jgi:hypothetical protein
MAETTALAKTEREVTARRYSRFAEREAVGRSPLYEMLGHRIARDDAMLDFLMQLPEAKRQPNLLLGAVKYLFGTQQDWPNFQRVVRQRADAIRDVMMRRSTQTNEAARCATLLPALMQLPQPLALLEVGASAGLCLQPDRYAYDYGRLTLAPACIDTPLVLPCAADERVPLPPALPDIVWRAGLDLDPIDVNDKDQCAWLEALVWPEQHERLARLRAAIAIARRDPPRLVRGNLLTDLAPLAAQAPRDATLVIFHSAVLAYVWPQDEREKFAREVAALDAMWIANETPDVFPSIAARAGGARMPGNFLLAVNAEPVAWTDHHGASIGWISRPLAPLKPQ